MDHMLENDTMEVKSSFDPSISAMISEQERKRRGSCVVAHRIHIFMKEEEGRKKVSRFTVWYKSFRLFAQNPNLTPSAGSKSASLCSNIPKLRKLGQVTIQRLEWGVESFCSRLYILTVCDQHRSGCKWCTCVCKIPPQNCPIVQPQTNV